MTPSGWMNLRLGDVLAQVSCLENVDSDTTYDLLGVRWYGNGCRLHSTVQGNELKTKALNRVTTGCVTYNKMWTSKTAFAVIAPEFDGLYATSEYPTFSPKSDSVSLDFLRYLMCTRAFTIKAKSSCKGTTSRARLAPDDFLKLSVILPPFPEQKKIAAILGSVDEAIAATQAVIDQTRKVKQGLLQQLLTRGIGHTRFKKTEIGEIPEEWEVRLLGDICEIGNGATPQKSSPDYWLDGTIAWVSSGKVNDGYINVPTSHITTLALQDCPLRLLPAGTVVVAMIGQGKTRGMAAMLRIDAAINQNLAYMIPGKTLDGFFLLAYLQHNYARLRGAGRGSNQDALNCRLIKRFAIPLPPIAEQERIASAVSLITAAEQDARDTLAAYERLKTGAMQDLLTGRVRVKGAA